MRVLISVFDKRGIELFARCLAMKGWEIISTGGTARVLAEAGIPVTEVSDYTGFPEMMDGRLKTLHPKIHGGILGRPQDEKVMVENGITTIEMVVVNLYPFEKVVEDPDCPLRKAIENIDIGGPTMIRAAAKNWERVAVVVDPQDYPEVLSEIVQDDVVSQATKYELMKKAFARTAAYEWAISNFLRNLFVGRCE